MGFGKIESLKVFEAMMKIPGARRGSHGVILPMEDGGSFYAYGLRSEEETEGLTRGEVFYLAFCSKTEILRLRELRTAHDYLLRLRANAIVDSARACRVFSARKRDVKSWSLTKYYHSKDAFKARYIDNLSRADRNSLREMPAGLAMTAEANALCMGTVMGNVVLVSEPIEYFLRFMNICYYGELLQIPLVDRVHALIIAVRVFLQSEAIDFDLDSRGSLPDSAEHVLKDALDWQMAFIFGHEFSHHLCGHVSSETRSVHVFDATAGLERSNVANARVLAHDMEHQADVFAIRNIAKGKAVQSRIAGAANQFFVYLNFVENVLSSLSPKKSGMSNTHPSPLERIRALREGLPRHVWPGDASLHELMSDSNQYLDLFVRFCEVNRPDLLGFYGSVYLPSYKGKPLKDRIDY